VNAYAPGVDRVLVVDETLGGESRSAVVVAAGDDELVVKLVPGGQRAVDNQRRLVRLVRDLRRRGYPAPEYVGVGESGGVIFTVQRRLPGQTLHRGPGMPPAPEVFAAVLPSLLSAIELQRDAGDLAHPPWPGWLLDTIETGGDSYCLHATMRQSPSTAALLRRLQTLARRNRRDKARRQGAVHFDMNPANILHAGGRLSGVVDWNMPFDGAGQGDRGFDIATLLFYTYDIEQPREARGRSLRSARSCSRVLQQRRRFRRTGLSRGRPRRRARRRAACPTRLTTMGAAEGSR
jgi:aminoglycoside phosphotransferase (APT) family kinase protein